VEVSIRNDRAVGPVRRYVALAAAVGVFVVACSGEAESGEAESGEVTASTESADRAESAAPTEPSTSTAPTTSAEPTTAIAPTTSAELGGPTTTIGVDVADSTPADGNGSNAQPAGVDTFDADPVADAAFVETFDTIESLDRFDFAIHHAVPYKEPIHEWLGDHDLSCAAPPSTRTIELPGNREPGDGKTYTTDTGDAVYWCAPDGTAKTAHLMTTFATVDYAQVDFSPKETFTDVRRVCWDQNLTDLGIRKWTQLVVVDAETFEENDERMDYVSPRVDEGPASFATKLTGDVFLMEVVGGSTNVRVGHDRSDNDFRGLLTTDKKRRFTTCVTDLEDGTVEIELEREADTEIRTLQGGFPDGPVRVIFQDDTYNNPKSPPTLDVADPLTWHWDNIVVETD
jgi:hypothetical protein